MENLPIEILAAIRNYLSLKDAIVSAFTCRRMLSLCAPILATHIVDLRIVFEENACIPQIVAETRGNDNQFELCISLCQCAEPHALDGHLSLLQILIPLISPHLERLIIEDYFLLKSSFIRGRTMDAVLSPVVDGGHEKLCWLEMHNVDLSMVGPKSMILIGKMKSLGQLAVIECGVRVPLLTDMAFEERVFAAMVQCTLVDLQLTACQYVTDRLLRYVSRVCNCLELADFSGCKGVTAKGIAHFAETIAQRKAPILSLKMKNTSVTSCELQMHLCHECSPATKQGPWAVTQLNCCHELGATANHVTLLHSARHPDKKIMLYA